MKRLQKLVLPFACSILVLTTGCKLFGANPAPPSSFEQKLFHIETNYVNHVVTNTVTQTNWTFATQYVQVTNTQNQIVTLTNLVPVPAFVTLTNVATITVTNYDYQKPSDSASAGVGVISTAANMAFPGSGALAGLAATFALGLWGKLRSTNKTHEKVNGVLVQGLETAREVLQTTPQGAQLDTALKSWLVSHQSAAGVLGNVSTIVQATVDNSAAQNAAKLISQEVAGAAPATAKAVA